MSKRKSNKKCKQMICDVYAQIYLPEEECHVDVNWSKWMVPAIEDIRVCNVTCNEYLEWEVVSFGVKSLTADQLKATK